MSYHYRFDRVDIRKAADAYQNVIHRAAEDGWRLVQILVAQPAAIASDYIVVLERPAGTTDA